MQVPADAVKRLRDLTGRQMMKCKDALVRAGGDMEQAIKLLVTEAGGPITNNPRPTNEGRVGMALDPARIAEGKLRTWFADNVLAEQPFVKDESTTVGQLLGSAGLKLVSFVRYRVGTPGS